MTGWRYHLQHPLTGEWLGRDVPLQSVTLTRRLSGPWSVAAELPTPIARDAGLTSDRVWDVQVWADRDDRIGGGGILLAADSDAGTTGLTFIGHAGYPTGLPYLGSIKGVVPDVYDLVRALWTHVQSYPDGKLGVVVDGHDRGVGIGTTKEPYTLAWYDQRDVGQEIDTLAREHDFDYLEHHEWVGEAVAHRLLLGRPRLGRRRTDISFVAGENIADPKVEGDGVEWAQYAIGYGAGEGSKMIRTPVVGTRTGRLRRVAVVNRPDVTATDRLSRLAQAEVRARGTVARVPDVIVQEHPNAPLGSWNLGDEVLVRLRDFDLWCRIVEETIVPAAYGQAAVLKLEPVA